MVFKKTFLSLGRQYPVRDSENLKFIKIKSGNPPSHPLTKSPGTLGYNIGGKEDQLGAGGVFFTLTLSITHLKKDVKDRG